MKKLYQVIFVLSVFWLNSQNLFAQKMMGIGTEMPNPRAVLELNIENSSYQQGFLPPRMTTANRNAFATILGPTTLAGMTVFDITDNSYYVWDGAIWQKLATSAPIIISATGINGALVTSSGLGFTIDGLNFVQQVQSLITGDVIGSFQDGFTVTGLNSAPINFGLINNGDLLQFNGTSIVGFNPSTFQNTSITGVNGILINQTGQGFTIDGGNLITSIAGSNGITINQTGQSFTITGASQTLTTIIGVGISVSPIGTNSFTIDGSNLIQSITGVNGVSVAQIGQFVTITGANAQLTSISGINGAQVSQNGQGFTFDGSNLVQTITGGAGVMISTITGGFNVDFTTQLTSIIGVNGALVSQNGQGFTVDGANLQTSITGANGVSINQVGSAFTITGASQTLSSIVGINGAIVNQNGQGFTFDGSNLVQTITGGAGVTITTIIGGFNVDVATVQATSIVGVSGLSVLGVGSSLSVSGAGMVILQQSLANPIGTAATAYSPTALFKTPVFIPAGVKTLQCTLNAYVLDGSGTADFLIQIDNASPVNVTLSTNSTSSDNIVTINSPSISTKAGNTVMIKVFARDASGLAQAAYIQGISLTVFD